MKSIGSDAPPRQPFAYALSPACRITRLSADMRGPWGDSAWRGFSSAMRGKTSTPPAARRGCRTDRADVWWDRHLHGGAPVRGRDRPRAEGRRGGGGVVVAEPRSTPPGFRTKRRRDGIPGGWFRSARRRSSRRWAFASSRRSTLAPWDGNGSPDAIDDLLAAIGRTGGGEAATCSGHARQGSQRAKARRSASCRSST